MSYGFKYVGRKSDVKAAVAANSGIPDNVKKFVVDSIAAIPDAPAPTPGEQPCAWEQYQGDIVHVEGTGHEPGIHNIIVKTFVSPVFVPVSPPEAAKLPDAPVTTA